jgi:hypothetical protein
MLFLIHSSNSLDLGPLVTSVKVPSEMGLSVCAVCRAAALCLPCAYVDLGKLACLYIQCVVHTGTALTDLPCRSAVGK